MRYRTFLWQIAGITTDSEAILHAGTNDLSLACISLIALSEAKANWWGSNDSSTRVVDGGAASTCSSGPIFSDSLARGRNQNFLRGRASLWALRGGFDFAFSTSVALEIRMDLIAAAVSFVCAIRVLGSTSKVTCRMTTTETAPPRTQSRGGAGLAWKLSVRAPEGYSTVTQISGADSDAVPTW